MTALVITGTGTGVGKTVATAALACCARRAGLPVAVCKPVQTGIGTGVGDGDDDLAEVGRLSGITELIAGARYPQPLAPVAAAADAGMALSTRAELLELIRTADRPGRLTLVEGAGGLLVELGADGVTLADLAGDLGAPVLLVVDAELGTLNHTALTLEALAARGIACAGLVIGSWPESPGAAVISNREALPRLAPIRAVLPAGSAALGTADFAGLAAAAFDPDWIAALVG